MVSVGAYAQSSRTSNPASSLRGGGKGQTDRDSTSTKGKEIPKGIKVWTVDKRFGEITAQSVDTVTHMYPNSAFTSGTYGEYNTTGNIGAPRINRIFTNRITEDADFLFTQPYDYFTVRPEDFLFTNTRSPYALVSYDYCGNRINGEDHFNAKYAVNAGKRLGFGFKINYLYGRGYYSDQNTSLFNTDLYGSYMGDRYQMHVIFSTNAQKIAENGGVTNDMYITHPESFSDNFAANEIPTVLNRNWNRNSHKHIFLTHRYSLGFHRSVPMTEEEIEAKKFAMEAQKENARKARNDDEDDDDNRRRDNKPAFAGRPDNAVIAKEAPAVVDTLGTDSLALEGRQTLDLATADSIMNAEKQKEVAAEDTSWTKKEFVPVTSFIHTAQFDTHDRIYQAYSSPSEHYANDFFDQNVIGGDSIYDNTKYTRLRNTFAISMLEGFNKWMFAGLKFFAASDLRHYSLPDTIGRMTGYTDHDLSIGGQITRTQGSALHYNLKAETWLLGDDIGQVKLDGNADLNFRFLGDTVTLAAKAFFHNERANYYMRHFHGRHFWWDDDLSMSTHTHLEGLFAYQKTRTALRFAADELTNYTYFGEKYDVTESGTRHNYDVAVRQSSDPITVLTASIDQKLRLGIVNWESVVTYQKSTKQEVLPVPMLNIYSNLYLKFRIAKVLNTELGCDMRYFTEYEAPDYVPALGQFAVQENEEKVKIGNYPILNVYANFNLKGTRFYFMYTHANQGYGNKQYFLAPHYPINPSVLRIGVSWPFFN